MSNMFGGFTETQDATEETQKLCDQVKCQVEEKTNEKYERFRAVKYRSQVVAGMIYLIKVHVGGYLHLKVLQNLEGEIMLLNVEEEHCKYDPIVPF